MENKENYKIIKEFIYGDLNIYDLVNKLHYKNMYELIYEESFKEANCLTLYATFLDIAYKIYIRQTALNISLKLVDGSLDEFLIGCIVMETYKRFPNAYYLSYIDGNHFKKQLTEMIKTNYYGDNEKNINIIKSLKK